MIKETLYRKTCDILFNAYFNNTLTHSLCTSCAIGNLVAEGMGYKIRKKSVRPLCYLDVDSKIQYKKEYVIWMDSNGRELSHNEAGWSHFSEFNPEIAPVLSERWRRGLEEIKSTGYTIAQLQFIENSFEMATRGETAEDWDYNGLEAVINALNIIHEVEDNNELIRFKNHYSTLCHV